MASVRVYYSVRQKVHSQENDTLFTLPWCGYESAVATKEFMEVLLSLGTHCESQSPSCSSRMGVRLKRERPHSHNTWQQYLDFGLLPSVCVTESHSMPCIVIVF